MRSLQRAAAAQRMRNSMTQEQRDELDALAQQAFGSPDLMQSLAQLDDNLQALRPGEDWGGSERFDGEQGLGLGDGTGVLQDLADLDDLADQLSQSYDGARMDDVDLDKLARQLGDQSAVDARTLAQLEQALRDTGYLRRGSDGQLKLSPKAMRQLGQALLRDVANRMSARQGQRDLRQAGAAGERSGATREWAFGDTEPWDVTRTVTNAIVRNAAEGRPLTAATGGDRSQPFLDIRDVEVTETEARTQAAVALLVDTSFSMAMDGRWVPMKRTALALHHLIRSRFRGDALQVIGFGRHAQVMEIEELTALDAMWDKGTNLHHALLLANRHFRKHPHAQPVLLIVTDGEPTSHLEPDGEVYFAYPPHPLTIAYSVRELDNAGRLGAQTTFSSWARTPASAGSSTRWPAASTAGWSLPSSTTSVPPSSVPTWVPATRSATARRTGTGSVPTAASGSDPGPRAGSCAPTNGRSWPHERAVPAPRTGVSGRGRGHNRRLAGPEPTARGALTASSGESSGVGETRERVGEDLPERRLGLQLAQHADPAEPGAVDQEVRRRQVQLQRERVRRVAGVVDADELGPHPLSGEAEPLDPGRLDERRQVVQQRIRVDLDVILDEALTTQAGQQLVPVLDRGDPDQRAHRQRQRAAGEPGHRAEVEYPESAGSAVGGREHPEVAGVRVRVEHACAGRTGEQEPHQSSP